MNGDTAAELAPLAFLGAGPWTLHAFADDAKGLNYRGVVESTRQVDASSVLPLSLIPARRLRRHRDPHDLASLRPRRTRPRFAFLSEGRPRNSSE